MKKITVFFFCMQVFLLRAMDSEEEGMKRRIEKARDIVGTMRNRADWKKDHGQDLLDEFNCKKAEEIFKAVGPDEVSCFKLDALEREIPDYNSERCRAFLWCRNGYKSNCAMYLEELELFEKERQIFKKTRSFHRRYWLD